MVSRCANSGCDGLQFRRDGLYFRPSDGRHVQRWKCKKCRKRFSEATFQKAYCQNKRRVNHMVFKLLCSGVSMRRASLILNIHRITVARKLAYLAELANEKQRQYRSSMPKVKNIQLDELITIEHTKCKPLSISMVVESTRRKILGFQVSVIPASGLLAQVSRKKYGRRPNKRKFGIKKLLRGIDGMLEESPNICTDEDTLYPSLIKMCVPDAKHRQYKGAKGCVSGQGELKKLRFDPLFSINHTFAMLRANINRLFRRTWCTTKKIEGLECHLSLYMHFHNTVLTAG